jgi:tRNA-splicing endonuclease subunit Sen2
MASIQSEASNGTAGSPSPDVDIDAAFPNANEVLNETIEMAQPILDPSAVVDAAIPTEPTKPKPTTHKKRGPSRAQQMNAIYGQPLPLKTFPLPTFIPSNPLSLVHLLTAWVSQLINRPSSHPEPIYIGLFTPDLRAVHVTDPRSIQALWKQGFYGKGSLSRSEPSWLDREKRRVGAGADKTSEEVTRQRRKERQEAKWERARKEREAIEQRLREEQEAAERGGDAGEAEEEKGETIRRVVMAPTGPEEILRLPNSHADLALSDSHTDKATRTDDFIVVEGNALNLGSLDTPSSSKPNSAPVLATISHGHISTIEYELPSLPTNPVIETDILGRPLINGRPVTSMDPTALNTSANRALSIDTLSNGSTTSPPSAANEVKRKKSVRFSPDVDDKGFGSEEPPTPSPMPMSGQTSFAHAANPSVAPQGDAHESVIKDREHLQLTPEEAFFLSYGLGVLSIHSPSSAQPIPTRDLLTLFRQASYFPPPAIPQHAPDDQFMLNYVVYHHFRSLGWVVRGGTKFGVDYLLYNRGPVFTHAEFGVIVIPSYSAPYWTSEADEPTKSYVREKQRRDWSWLHAVNRVNSQVKKTVVLVYVDVPEPLGREVEERMRVDEILGRYRVREFVLKRWVSNRSRD